MFDLDTTVNGGSYPSTAVISMWFLLILSIKLHVLLERLVGDRLEVTDRNSKTQILLQFVPILLVLSTSSMLLLDQRTLQIKYRVPATEIYRLSLSPYLDNIAVFHVKAVSSLQIVLNSGSRWYISYRGKGTKDKGCLVNITRNVDNHPLLTLLICA